MNVVSVLVSFPSPNTQPNIISVSYFLKLTHVNVLSLLCHIDKFYTIFYAGQFDIILASETWLKSHISDKRI